MSLGYNQQEILHLELNYWLLFCTPCWGLKKKECLGFHKAFLLP